MTVKLFMVMFDVEYILIVVFPFKLKPSIKGEVATKVFSFFANAVSVCVLVYTSTAFAFALSVVCRSVVPNVTVGAVSLPVAVRFVVVIFAVESRERVRYASPPVSVSTLSGVTASMPLNFVDPASNSLAAFVGI